MKQSNLVALVLSIGVVGCDLPSEMSALEALEALGQANRSSEGEQATSEVVEISTDFTIGGALENAAQEIAAFWQSQAPCTTVSREGATTTIDYGGLSDPCTYRGHSYAGVNTVTVRSTTLGELDVLHTWTGFTNGDVQVDGEATVTWSGNDLTRRVQTTHTWTDVAEGATVDVEGDHVQGLLDPQLGVLGGLTMEGTRSWTDDEAEVWDLEMVALEIRLQDPAPQAGTLLLTDPKDRQLDILYERVDEETIQATLRGVRGGDRVYHIHRLGDIDEVSE